MAMTVLRWLSLTAQTDMTVHSLEIKNVLFTIVEAYSSELNVQTPQLIQIDLAQGSIQKLTQLDSSKSWFLVGTADNTLILKSIEVTQK